MTGPMVDRSSLTDEVEEAKRAARTALDTPFGVFDGDEFAAAVETLLTALEAAQARAEKAEASLVEAMGATREKDWPISTDGHHSISNIRRWMARQLMDSGLSDEEALGVVAYHPAITDISGAQRSELSTQLRDEPLPPSGVRDETDTLSRGSET